MKNFKHLQKKEKKEKATMQTLCIRMWVEERG